MTSTNKTNNKIVIDNSCLSDASDKTFIFNNKGKKKVKHYNYNNMSMKDNIYHQHEFISKDIPSDEEDNNILSP